MSEKHALQSFLTSTAGIAVMAVAIVALNFLVGFIHVRADLTNDNLYTLSSGSREILGRLDTPVTLRFYATQGNDMPPFLKAYAKRIDDLLKEYEIAGGGNIIVEKFAPEPNTDAEDAAAMDGVTGNMIQGGDMLYLGIAVVCLEESESIPFLDPRQEQKLEYNLSRMIHRVSNPGRVKVGVMSSIQIMGFQPPPGQFGQPPMPGAPAWEFINQLKRDFDVEDVAMSADSIPEVDVLLIVHPKDISDEAQFAIDQYVLGGGKVIAFVDPHSYIDMNEQSGANPQQRFQATASSDLPKLFDAWGVDFASDKILLDNRYALSGPNGKYLVVAGFREDALNRDDITLASLERMRTGWPGSFGGDAPEGIEKTVLLSSSDDAGTADGFKAKFTAPDGFGDDFKPDGKKHAIAIKLTGKFKTAFPNGKPKAADAEGEEKEDAPAETALTEGKEEAAIILVADVDFLHHEFWTQQSRDIFGRQFLQPVEENINFLLNSLEQLGGDSSLIKIRSRGVTARPLEKLVEKRLEAEKRKRAEIDKYKEEEQEANRKLQELQRSKAEDSQKMVLSSEQLEELKSLGEKRKEARVKLRETEKELRRDIERMQAKIIALNVGLMPILVIVAGLGLGFIRRSKVKAQ
jgi:ABC-type uncharacterized transport system involved in gliding motility auxiliary subunit